MPSQRNDRVPRTDRCREWGRAVVPDGDHRTDAESAVDRAE
ncbi:hypothetical protein [Halorubrum sp. LN27]|nr:hypothetical protein [Halorubrum sp. LN27]